MRDFFSFLRFKNAVPATGKLLLSEPLMDDPYFKRAVILLAHHDEKEGSTGFILNKPTEMKVGQLIKDFPEFSAPVFLGGPVNNNHLFYVHNKKDLLPTSRKIKENLYWGGDFEKLKTLIKHGEITEDDICFFAGYSGWDKGQLKVELNEKSWIVTTAKLSSLFLAEKKSLWRTILEKMGNQFSLMANFPESPALN